MAEMLELLEVGSALFSKTSRGAPPPQISIWYVRCCCCCPCSIPGGGCSTIVEALFFKLVL